MSAVYLVTGATSGIGEELAHRYASQGDTVWACGRNQDKLQQMADSNANILPLAFDITDLPQTKRKLADLTPLPTTWILNAGDCEYINDGVMDATLFKRVIDINVVGLANCVEACQPSWSAGHNVVIVGSIASEMALPRAEAYGASKAAVSYLARTLALDLAPKKIRVSTVYPGFVKTPLTNKNDFPMPMMVSVERAAQEIMRGIDAGQKSIYFPKRFTLLLRFIGALPYAWQSIISQKLI
ncbi:SDR family NAD(P)-dependent oxidoreductase [Vibrio gallicus]|uniref:SDR family NAD(P)-dependent oxidoreductase n=1 Tax=Vibrio gallicus TaxID=190897 RepID=UPI0021C36D2D|nr:SDR family NAD(P)-dependent oxidoreductase [Vibrio gallicus]